MRAEEKKIFEIFKLLVKQSSFNIATLNFAHQMALSTTPPDDIAKELRAAVGRMIEAQEALTQLIEKEFQALERSAGND